MHLYVTECYVFYSRKTKLTKLQNYKKKLYNTLLPYMFIHIRDHFACKVLNTSHDISLFFLYLRRYALRAIPEMGQVVLGMYMI